MVHGRSRGAGPRMLALGVLVALACEHDTQVAPETAASTRAVTTSAVEVAGFGAYARSSLLVRKSATVAGGDVGVKEAGAGPLLLLGNRLLVAEAARAGVGQRLFGDSVYLGSRAAVGDVYTNKLTDKGATKGAVAPFVAAQMPELPALARVTPSTTALTVSGVKAICPGAYGAVQLNADAVLRLVGGVYELTSLRMLERSRIEALGPVQIRIKNQLRSRQGIFIGPASGVTLTAKDIRIEISGADADDPDADNWESRLRAASIGYRSDVRGVLLSPNGLFVVVREAKLRGAVVAKNVIVGEGAQVTFEDGFGAAAALPPVCDDGNACTVDTCNAGVCSRSNASAGIPCGGGDACTGSGSCDGAGTCQSTAPPVLDDGNPCTTDSCDPASGVEHTPVAAGTACSDGNACNGAETCNGSGQCQSGTAPALDDGNVCTADGCDPATGVTHTPVPSGTTCSDGNACNGAETCNASGVCAPGQALPVDDGNPCTVDACDPGSGVSHIPAADGTSCSDGNGCNGAELCSGGTCVAGTSPAVDDGNPCTSDSCDPATGVHHTPLQTGTSCGDGNACNGTETCDGAGLCVPGTPPPVDDGNICTIDSCDPATGVHHSFAQGGASCEDGTVCDGTEVCDGAGRCMPGTPLVIDDTNPCTVDACDPVLGVVHTPVAAGTACSGGDACSGQATCDGMGNCVAGSPAQLDDGNPCTADSCDPTTGASHTPVAAGTACSDGNACNGAEACDAQGACQPGTPPVTDDGNPCTADSCDPVTGVVHTPVEGCNPDPGTIVPPADTTIPTTVFASAEFLYTGSNPIQPGVAPGAIELQRGAVVHGRVIGRDGAGIDGVEVSIADHAELGHTFTRPEGFFVMAVNGGGPLTVRYAKSGYLSADRQIDVPWQDQTTVEDTILVALDPVVTPVDLSAATMQVARGSVSSDTAGERQATVLFPAGTAAGMTLPDGTSQALSSLHVRATEFTVGQGGPKAMPAPLPPTSHYTYALDLSVDEAIAAGAKSVAFNPPLPFYVENFVGFAPGTTVPLGYYDATQGAWIPSESGVVLRILSVSGGIATLDTNGDGQPDDATRLAALGVTDAERQQLATLYAANQTLWRVRIAHFSPWDLNWAVGPPSDAKRPDQDPDPELPEDETCEASGSIIECQNQILGEDIPLVGTPFALHYRSDRAIGRATGRTLKIPLSGPTVPASLLQIILQIDVAGRHFEQRFPPQPNLKTKFVWDGLDAFGRRLSGKQPVRTRIGYAYPAVYRQQSRFAEFFSGGITGNDARTELTLWRDWSGFLGSWYNAQLGGLSLTPHHVYDVSGRVLYFGDGSRRSRRLKYPVVRTVLENLNREPPGIAVGADGSLYYTTGFQVWRRDRNGVSTAIAGRARFPGFFGDGGPATEASFSPIMHLAIGPDGSVYVADEGNGRVRKIDRNGIINTVAGGGSAGSYTQGGLATDVAIYPPHSVAVSNDGVLFIAGADLPLLAVDTSGYLKPVLGASNSTSVTVAADGTVYFSHCNTNRVWRRQPTGAVELLAGTGTPGFAGDGGPATEALLSCPDGLWVDDADGSLFIADTRNNRVRRVGADGIITTAAGSGTLGSYGGDGGPATAALFNFVMNVAGGPDRRVYINDRGNFRIRTMELPMPGLGAGEASLPSEDGSEVYVFSSDGRHLRTIDARTKASRYTFSYDAAKQLIGVTDADGNVTSIERDASGRLQAIVGPFGHRTVLGLDGSGYLSSFIDPLSRSLSLTYTPSGLLTGLTNPRGVSKTYRYDVEGRLLKDEDAAGGSTSLLRTDDPTGAEAYTVHKTTALGRHTSYRIEELTTGVQQRTNTLPGGLVSTELLGGDYGRKLTLPDGTVSTVSYTPDPRFEMMAAVSTEKTVTPSSLTQTISTSRTAVLANALDPLSHTQLTETTSINGAAFTNSYDVATRTLTSRTPLGRQVTTVLDAKGHAVSTQTAGLTAVQLGYDSRGRLASVAQGARTYGFTYDADGNVSAVTDPLARTMSYAYDAAGRVIEQTLPDGRVIAMSYDANDNIVSITPPGRPSHGMTYTPVDLVASYSPPDIGAGSTATLYAYNLDRQLTQVTRPDGVTIDLAYDAAGRISTITEPRGATTYSYEAGTGRLKTIAAPDGGTLTYDYDGSLLTRTTWGGAVTGSVSRTLNGDFKVASESVNGDYAVSFQFDSDKLLVAAGALTITRNPQNGLVTDTQLGGIAESIAYDSFGDVVQLGTASSGAILLSLDYTRDLTGRIVEQKESASSSMAQTFGYAYDAAGRLAEVTKDGTTISRYTYDANGNRTRHETSSGSTTATYDAQDRLLTYGSSSYTYTANGEVASKTEPSGTTSYVYDAAGNLISVRLPNDSLIEYIVDGQHRRVGRRVDGTLTQGFLYGDSLRPVAWLGGDLAIKARFVYGAHVTVPDYMVTPAGTYRIVSDHRGSVRLVIDSATGQVAQRIEYDEWGNVLSDTNPGFQPFGFAGGLYDRDTKLTHFGAREYDAAVGRWTTKDPVGLYGGDTNLYGYVIADPINFFDPTGRDWWSATKSFATGLVVTAATTVAVSALAASAPVAGAVVGVAVAAYGGFMLGKGLYEVVAGEDWSTGAALDAERRVDIAAGIAGSVVGGALACRGAELKLNPNWRFAPFGNRTGNKLGELPHYHRRGVDPSGQTTPGQGIGRHRPWETKSTDQSWWDRF